ncbi:hypothetical protein XENTR_v10004414 [Xenopus tropicalis]|nr:hypothetical protein XENTR_v10004414 [Xenopus tropicalis]
MGPPHNVSTSVFLLQWVWGGHLYSNTKGGGFYSSFISRTFPCGIGAPPPPACAAICYGGCVYLFICTQYKLWGGGRWRLGIPIGIRLMAQPTVWGDYFATTVFPCAIKYPKSPPPHFVVFVENV